MRRVLTSVQVLALVVGFLALYGAKSASAIEVQLPGERQLALHGFYETRLLFTGADFPANGTTFSQFRHVLDLETELEIFPDGIGPFDMMFLFSRWLVSYDCIYERGCGLFSGADSYGGAKRTPSRAPRNLKPYTAESPYVAGLPELRQHFVPGTLRSPVEKLNPGRRYRNCVNPGGVRNNPFPLAVLCNANNRSPLDAPIRTGAGSLDRVHAGSFNLELRQQFLNSARPFLGEDRFNELQTRIGDGHTISQRAEHERRASLSEAARLDALGLSGGDALRERAAALLHVDPSDTSSGYLFEAAITGADGGMALLDTRADTDRFEILAAKFAPGVRTSLWASGALSDAAIPFSPTIDNPIRPQGYFRSGVLDLVSPFEEGLAKDMSQGALVGVPAGINAGKLQKNAIPFFLGPDGINNTADDLPFETGSLVRTTPFAGVNDPYNSSTAGLPGLPAFVASGQLADRKGVQRELYGVFEPNNLSFRGCALNSQLLGGTLFTYNSATHACTDNATGASISDIWTAFEPAVYDALTPDQKTLAKKVFNLGCASEAERAFATTDTRMVGTNADGDCIRLNSDAFRTEDRIHFDVLPLLADSSVRPSEANLEPIDLTDLNLYANGGGATLPARPRAPDGGLYFNTSGYNNLIAKSSHIVSNLDLDFSEDELRWSHGGSEDEHEFKEGYLEFEMFDSQLYARVGKLIVVWGKTELFRNQDRNNPLDIGNGLFQPLEETRVGQWGVDLTFSPESFMRVGPFEDLRLELLWLFDDFEPTDLGKCGEGSALSLVCLKSFGAQANGLFGIGLVGESRPYHDYSGLKRFDYGIRLEGRFDRFTFAVSDFWGWDDGMVIETINSYGRANDSVSGAPLAAGGSSCTHRTDAGGARVGPNGIAGDADDIFPSAGGCLLWDEPDASGVQHLRASDEIAGLHTVNQTLFHTFCTVTFDPDEGFCLFDRLTDPGQFFLVTDLMTGLGALTGLAIGGIETLRSVDQGNNLMKLDDVVTQGQFKLADPRAGDTIPFQNMSTSLEVEQRALLGCGPAYATACHSNQQTTWANDSVIGNTLDRDPNTPGVKTSELGGGIDLMNADASVMTQEFSFIKAFSGGALVGTRKSPTGLVYSAGVNRNRVPGSVHTDTYLPFTPADAIAGDFSAFGVAETGAAGRARMAQKFETDGWIEPMPFTVNEDQLSRFGGLVFNFGLDAKNLDYSTTEFNLVGGGVGKLDRSKLEDPDPAIRKAELARVDGEYCASWFDDNPFAEGCTALEAVSSNFERFLIPIEILGPDRVFSPPETLDELAVVVAGNYELEATGDPISGPDGLFANNARILNGEFGGRAVKDEVVVTVGKAGGRELDMPAGGYDADPDIARQQARDFVLAYDPVNDCTNTALCTLEVSNGMAEFGTTTDRIAAATPISFAASDPIGNPLRINLLALKLVDQLAFYKLLNDDPGHYVEVPNSVLGLGAAGTTEVQIDMLNLFGNQTSNHTGLDIDGDGITDMDRDNDGVHDGADDFTTGPVTDDNIFCGSGLPGDLFQDLPQFTPAYSDEGLGSAAFAEAYPDGLPMRSPVFCSGLVGLAGATTQTLPFQRAGGDGTFGRRDFLWHGGQQLNINYQKRNVFGFGLDFAEDRTKSSWGIEFSWTANKLFGNSLTESSLSKSDEMVLSVSIDRPTFFNFLNPNRSFFLNFQFFVRYLTDYRGGADDRDGMFGTAYGPLSTTMVFTFFTGYFQDRLSPRVTMLYQPLESQGALISAISYRWNESFSTQIGFNAFFGHEVKKQANYFPALQYTSPTQRTGVAMTRGITPVINRDNATLRVRYSF
ncbi:MAG: hypothetical protein GY725_06730 [bacterium]|nr:hypothetical protein [bacterium]